MYPSMPPAMPQQAQASLQQWLAQNRGGLAQPPGQQPVVGPQGNPQSMPTPGNPQSMPQPAPLAQDRQRLANVLMQQRATGMRGG